MNQPIPQTTQGRPRPMIVGGRINEALRAVIYGPAGVGKTTFAADSDGAVLLDVEGGSKSIDVDRIWFRPREVDERGYVPIDYGEVLFGVDVAGDMLRRGQHLVLDGGGKLEAMLWRHIIERDNGRASKKKKGGEIIYDIESYGFGKGYEIAVDEWRNLMAKLDRLVARGIGVILVAHSKVKTFKNPQGEDYDRYNIDVHEKAAAFIKGWCDVVGFMEHESVVEVETDRRGRRVGRPKGISTGRRVLRTDFAAAYDAKARIPIDDSVEIDIERPWAPMAAALKEAADPDPQKVIDFIRRECERIGDPDLTDRVRQAVGEATDAAGVSRVDRLKRYLRALRDRPMAAAPDDDTDNNTND